MNKKNPPSPGLDFERKKLHTLMNLSSEGVLILDPKGTVKDVNNQIITWLGYRPKDVIGKNLIQLPFLSPSTKKLVASKFAQRLLGKKIAPYQLEINSKNGEKIIAQITAEIIKDSESKDKVEIIVLSDINKESEIIKQAELAEKKYKNLFDQMGDGVAIYKVLNDGESFVFQDINKAGEKIDKVDKEKIIGKDVTKIFPGIEQMGLLDIFKSVYKTGKPQRLPITEYKDKEIHFWRENFVYKISDNQIVSIYSDLTAEKKNQEKISYGQAIQKSITESTDDSICLIDTKLRYLYANPTHLKRLDKKLDQIVGQDYKLFHNPKTLDKLKEIIKEVLKTKKSVVYEYLSYRDKNYFIRTISPVINNDKLEAFAIISKNINEQKQYEIKIKDQLEDMEKLNQLMVGRELKMIELKNEIKNLKKEIK